MDTILSDILQYVDVLLLVLVRVTALFIITPIFGSRNIPNILKVGFGLITAFLITPTLDTEVVNQQFGLIEYVLIIFQEFIIGLILGFVAYMAFVSLYVAGQIIDTQIGFGIVNVLDPQSRIQMPVVANFFNIIAMLMLFSINGHHMILSAIFYSYKILPIASAAFSNVLVGDIVRMFGEMFIIGFKFSAPILAAIFITNVALGILAKTVPQMNVFLVGMPLKIFIGLFTLIIVLPLFPIIMDNIINGMFEDISMVLRDLVKK